MNRICVIGSINVDIVFSVDRIARPGETISSRGTRKFLGGKGQNQAIALRHAYPDIALAGIIGTADSWILDELGRQRIDVSMVRMIGVDTGSAFIQVDSTGQNSIVLGKGANHCFDREGIDNILRNLRSGDLVVLQNEINLLGYILESATARGIAVAFNPSPFELNICKLPLQRLKYLILNEIEGEGLTGVSDLGVILDRLHAMLPDTITVLTLGANGAICREANETFRVEGRRVNAIDTTAAGDTFMGYFLAETMRGATLGDALRRANIAASISVTRPGSASSIPTREEVEAIINT